MNEELNNVAEEYGREHYECCDLCTDYDVVESIKITTQAFKDGADWQKNSVWHDPSEDHDEDKPLLVLTQINTLAFWKGKFDTDKMVQQFGFAMAAEYNKPAEPMLKKWAYIKDILPIMD